MLDQRPSPVGAALQRALQICDTLAPQTCSLSRSTWMMR